MLSAYSSMAIPTENNLVLLEMELIMERIGTVKIETALPRSFYERPTAKIAIDLLGKILIHRKAEGVVGGRIVEVEAYLGEVDSACHASFGKTLRAKIFWEDPGIAYVFVNYGIHYCLNAITERRDRAGCVLIRALEPILGIEMMMKRRKTQDLLSLTNGPGKVTQAMGINLEQNSIDLTQSNLVITGSDQNFYVGVTSRIGISKAKNEPLRFIMNENAFVSHVNARDVVFEGRPERIKLAFVRRELKVSFLNNMSREIVDV